MNKIPLKYTPALEPDFFPASVWDREYDAIAAQCPEAKEIALCVYRHGDAQSVFKTKILPYDGRSKADTFKKVERMAKTMLWACGGWKIGVWNCPEIIADLSAEYSEGGKRAFDADLMGSKIYGNAFSVEALSEEPEGGEMQVKIGGNFDGCRVGFDLGGSDRKCAAVIDGKVVHSEEVKWSPYFEKDPQYHLDGIRDSIRRAAEKLPRLDAIGGSSAGIFVDNEPRVSSLFRGVSPEDFKSKVRPIFKNLAKEFGVPLVVANDGDVTALAGTRITGKNAMLGISMGTSLAAGYVSPEGAIRDWLSELAFVPVDYNPDAPADEWSGDIGCGVQYFSQQCMPRFMKRAGIDFDPKTPFPELLVQTQQLMAKGDERAAKIYETIGTCFGYAIAHYARFYPLKNILALGRVTTGGGADIVIENAQKVLGGEFPDLQVKISLPDENFKRLGQAVVAAGLPSLKK